MIIDRIGDGSGGQQTQLRQRHKDAVVGALRPVTKKLVGQQRQQHRGQRQADGVEDDGQRGVAGICDIGQEEQTGGAENGAADGDGSGVHPITEESGQEFGGCQEHKHHALLGNSLILAESLVLQMGNDDIVRKIDGERGEKNTNQRQVEGRLLFEFRHCVAGPMIIRIHFFLLFGDISHAVGVKCHVLWPTAYQQQYQQQCAGDNDSGNEVGSPPTAFLKNAGQQHANDTAADAGGGGHKAPDEAFKTVEPGRDDPGNGSSAAQSVAQTQQNIAHSQQRHIGAQGQDGIACAAEEQTQQQGLFVAPAQEQRAGKQCTQKAEQIFQAKRQREAGPGDAQLLRNGQDKQATVIIG